MADQPPGQFVDHLVAFGAPQVNGYHHHDPVTFPVGAGRLLAPLADPHLDVRVEEGGMLGGRHGGNDMAPV